MMKEASRDGSSTSEYRCSTNYIVLRCEPREMPLECLAWNTFAAGQTFEVPAKSGFDIEVFSGICEYICSFFG